MSEIEFRASVEAGLLDENVKPTTAAAYAASLDVVDVSDGALRRAVAKVLHDAPASAFVDGTSQRQRAYLRDLRRKIVKEREAAGEPLKELDARLATEDELARRMRLARRT